MDDAVKRLRLQLALRPGPWVAVVRGDALRARQVASAAADAVGVALIDEARPGSALVFHPADAPPAWAETLEARVVLALPTDLPADRLPRPPRLACHVGAGPAIGADWPAPLRPATAGEGPDPEPLLHAARAAEPGSREAVAALADGARALVERGWYADAGPFVEQLRFEAYRAAATTWEDRWWLGRVALVEELTGRLALAGGELRVAWESWRTAWWIRGEAAGSPEERAELARTGHALGALSILCGEEEEARSRLEHALGIYRDLGREADARAVVRTLARLSR